MCRRVLGERELGNAFLTEEKPFLPESFWDLSLATMLSVIHDLVGTNDHHQARDITTAKIRNQL